MPSLLASAIPRKSSSLEEIRVTDRITFVREELE